MQARDWLVTEDGQCQAWGTLEAENYSSESYRLYRFLTEVEDILQTTTEERQRLQAIYPRVRRLLTQADWLQTAYLEPNPETGWSVLMLYDEPDFSLTVQLVAWLPGRVSPIHNHATWGVVALLAGQEKNTFWRRTPSQESGQVRPVGSHVLLPGETISFMPAAIHRIETLTDQPTVTFNIYGEPNQAQQLEFDPIAQTAKTG